VDAASERTINRAVRDALGGVGLTAFDRLPGDLRTQAIARYEAKVAERGRDSGGHMQAVNPELRGGA
jgi:hypothetical protein